MTDPKCPVERREAETGHFEAFLESPPGFCCLEGELAELEMGGPR